MIVPLEKSAWIRTKGWMFCSMSLGMDCLANDGGVWSSSCDHEMGLKIYPLVN